jgi:hypothetical protein
VHHHLPCRFVQTATLSRSLGLLLALASFDGSSGDACSEVVVEAIVANAGRTMDILVFAAVSTRRGRQMRTTDLKRLQTAYTSPRDMDLQFALALGVDISAVEHLFREVFDDLDEKVFGVGWWAPHPGTKRRILISHYLVECIKSISTNIIEAALHLYEAVEFWERESEFVANAFSIDPEGKPHIQMPKPEKPEDDLAHRMATMHAVGFFRAAVGALDCLAAASAGVLGLPMDIKRTDLGRARNALGRSPEKLHQDFLSELDRAVADAGPQGWLSWMVDLRNMVVHRGRRWHMFELIPAPRLYRSDGTAIFRTTSIEHLPSQPDESQVEALLSSSAAVLTERGEDSLRGALRSSSALIEVVTTRLLAAWEMRRANPSLIQQPPEQWPDRVRGVSLNFEGFRPGSAPYDPSAWISNPEMGRQFRTAALDDDRRGLWKGFD